MQQQMPTFPTDPYQARCAGIGNLGIGTGLSGGTGKHFKVHNGAIGNIAFGNFNNYIQGDQEARGMTRIVFNGNSNRNEFHCGAENFQNCIASEIIDNTGNYQLNFVNANANMRYMRQQMNPSFHVDNQIQRCYIQRPQGQHQQARFVRVQGSKMRPNNVQYRNFNNNNNNQQRQKQNRRFITKGFNNYKTQKVSPGHTDGFFEEEEAGSSPKRCGQQQEYQNIPENEVDRKPNHSSKQEGQYSKSKACRSSTSSNTDRNSRTNNACSASNGLLEPKVEYVGNSSHDLSYDDITENSDDNNGDSDLRERLMRKKHDQKIKREPGELDSDEEEAETEREVSSSSKRKSKKHSETEDSSQKRFKNSDGTSSSEGKSRESRKSHKPRRKESGKNHAQNYSCHDNRCSPSQADKEVSFRSSSHKSNCSGTRTFGSSYPDGSTHNYCCSDAEVADLKEKMNSMKQSLREAQDKLLEANVVGSKKSLRMQEEISELKKQLEEAGKTETELKATLKNVENELLAKNTELTKLSLMNEVEKQDKAKLSAEMNRTYKERLTIEIEKLRALFDVEVAKMQAYYLSSNIYEEDANIPFSEVSSRSNADAQNQSGPPNEVLGNLGTEAVNTDHGAREVTSHNSHSPLVQSYYNASPQTSRTITATAPFSMFENVMAYNSLIHHQHIYAQTTAAASSGNFSSQGTGSSNTAHSGI